MSFCESSVTAARRAPRPWDSAMVARIRAAFAFGALVLAALPASAADGGDAVAGDNYRRLREVPEIAGWLQGGASGGPARKLTGMSVVRCNCTDRPEPHFPYVMVVVSTPAEDLVARLEAHENALRATPIAVRRGDRYCAPDASEPCYGDFEHPCRFSDARFGAVLSEYFPECRTAD